MIDNVAAGVLAASRNARIDASLIDAGAILGAFGADGAFGATIGRAANVVWQTRADFMVIDHTTSAVQSTRRWIAQVGGP